MDSWMGVGNGWVPWRFRSVCALTTQLLDIGYMLERFWCWRHHKKLEWHAWKMRRKGHAQGLGLLLGRSGCMW
jgi:hypothetical protein